MFTINTSMAVIKVIWRCFLFISLKILNDQLYLLYNLILIYKIEVVRILHQVVLLNQKPLHKAVGKFLPLPVCTRCWYAVWKTCCSYSASCLLLYGAPLCLSHLYNVLGTVSQRFPLFVPALPCVALRIVSLVVAALLGHVPHYFSWKLGDDHTKLAFWAHMTDILQMVAIHLGIF